MGKNVRDTHSTSNTVIGTIALEEMETEAQFKAF